MKLYKLTPKKNTAQAIVEFAIVLPILLLLLYGLLEAGRLLFMYSTIVTASRQAARYGSATGEGINPGVPRYQDCAGIRVAANRVDFLNAFDEYDVIIQHDTGPGTTAIYYCTNDPNNEPDPSLPLGPTDTTFQPANNTERIVITIEGDFNPIIPRIVPFIARTEAGGNPITSVSARTIITGVAIEVTPPPGSSGGPGTGGISLSITANPNSYTGTGQLITYTFTITNGGTGNITGPFTITGAPFSVDCTAAASSLAPGASTTCVAPPYYTTQTDVDPPGYLEFTAIVTGTGPDGTPAQDDYISKITYSAPVDNPAISLTKTASTTLATVGDSISYTFTLTNSGNVPLSPPYTVSDDVMGAIDCSSASGNLAPGAFVTCAPVYAINSNDVRQNQVINTATATALFGTQTITSNQVSATVEIYTGRLFLTVSASPASTSQVGQVITYTYTIKNNWNQDLTDPYALSASVPASGCSFSTGTLAPGASQTCTGTYAVTQADFEAGVIRNTVSASATRNNNTEDSNTVTNAVTVTGQNPALSLQASASPMAPTPPTKIMTVGTPITYTYTLTNVGNVTLSSPITVTDPAVSNISCSGTSLAPSGTITCTGTHTVVEADLSIGLITSQSNASALYAAKSQTVSASAPPITIITYDGPRLSLQITANPTTYPTTGQAIVYTYTLTNTGTVPLNGPYSVTRVSGPSVSVDCSTASSPLVSGASTTCVGSAIVSGPPGSSVGYSATARASDGTLMITSNTATATVSNPVLGCGDIAVSPTGIAIPGASGNRSMSLTFTNPNTYPVTVQNVVVSWNPTGGPGGGTLVLQSASLNGTGFFSGSDSTGGPLTITPTTTLTIPGNNASSTITFVFGSNYQTRGNPSITINLSTVGCESTPIHSP